MMKKFLSTYGPHLLSILLFLAIASAYFSPLIGGNKVMFQSDIKQAEGMSHESQEFKEKTGEQTLWTNSMFSGMPTYQISADYPNNWSQYFFSTVTYMLGYDRYPITSLWMLMTCMFLMLLTFRVNVWVAFAVSIGYAFSTFNIIGIEVGHANKIWTLMYSPLIIAAINITFRKKYFIGAGLMAFAMAMNIYANHLQITYYIFIILLIWMIVKLVFAIREKAIKDYGVAIAILIGSAAIGISANASNLWTTYEYGKVSTRGGSELTLDSSANEDGLSWDYIFNDYSYDRGELFTFIIPNFYGGASGMDIDKKSDLARAIQRNQNLPTYWGDQRYVAGPFYLGAILCFLMVLGIIMIKKRSLKIWLLVAGFLAISLSLGRNSFILSELFFFNFPLYNKFRSVTMFTSMTQLVFALLAGLGVHAYLKNLDDSESTKKLNLAFYLTGGLCLVMALIGPSFFSFTNASDVTYGIKDQVLAAFIEHRKSMMRSDALRSLVFIALAWAALFGLKKWGLKREVALIGLALLFLIDLWPVNKRYGEGDPYERKKKDNVLFTPTQADNFILKDTSKYRVLNASLQGGPFNDATTSYYHNSIGGYHGAKIQRYQDLIAYCISPEMQNLARLLNQENRSFTMIDSFMRNNMPVLNMLNTRYMILNPSAAPLKNEYAAGNAWFVNTIKQVATPDDEIMSLMGSTNTHTTAVVNEKWSDYVNGLSSDPNATIELTSYQPNHLVYKSKSGAEALAIFSEIYYKAGWQAYIDNEEVDHIRANFALRALKVPAGEHTIEFKFHPASFYSGESIALGGSIVLVLLVLAALARGIMRFRNELSEEA